MTLHYNEKYEIKSREDIKQLVGKVILLDDKTIIGSIGFKSLESSIENVHIGSQDVGKLYVNEEFRKKGYGTKIVVDALGYISLISKKENLPIEKIFAGIDPNDSVAKKILEKVGFSNYKSKKVFLGYEIIV
jgi:RimJ/RimL family protein N-acetyltransferase